MTLTIPQLVIILTLLGLELVLLALAYWSLRRPTKTSAKIDLGDHAFLGELLEKQLKRQERIAAAAAAIKPVELAKQVKKYALSGGEFSKQLEEKGGEENLIAYFAEAVNGGEELIELLLNALALAGKAQPVVEESAASDPDPLVEQLQVALAEKERELEELRNAPVAEEAPNVAQDLAAQVEKLQAELAEKDFQLEELRSEPAAIEEQTEDRGESEQAEQLRAALAEKEAELDLLRKESAASVMQNANEYCQELEQKMELLDGRLARWQELLKKAQEAQREGRIDQTMTALEVQLDELADRLATQAPVAGDQEGLQEQIDLLRAESMFLIAMQSMTPLTPKEQ